MKEIIDYILELIYPTTCGICGKFCKEALCKKCEIKLKKYEINYFKKSKKGYFNESMHIFRYEGIIRDKLISYKFQDKAYLYRTFSKIILKNEKACDFLKNYDIIVPVPIHKKRMLTRGYNQTELVAHELAKYTSMKMENKILLKRKNIISQSQLKKYQRKENVKNVFFVKNIEKILDKRILLFDDIYTTGSTVNECSKVLKGAGAKEIGVLTIAKD